MGENINKEFDEFQKDLTIREKKLKPLITYTPDNIEISINDLKKEIIT